MLNQTAIILTEGNIIDQPVTVIVNAAKNSLEGGSGIDGYLHSQSGPQLLHECTQLPISNGVRCATGDAKITGAHKLTAKGITHIIHTVGPTGSMANKEQLLYNAYINSLALAHQYGHTTIAFPAISAGLYGYDVHDSAPIALKAIQQFIEQNPNDFKEIRLVVRPQDKSDTTKYPFFDEYLSVITGKRIPLPPAPQALEKKESPSFSSWIKKIIFDKKTYIGIGSLVLAYFGIKKLLALYNNDSVQEQKEKN